MAHQKRPRTVALLLLGSGLSALVYQIAWQREFRLVFGSSTAASAAVLGIFIGGGGVGSLLFGKRSDAHPRPLRLYAQLELGIAALAALSPFLLMGARAAYRAAGGTFGLGLGLGTALRVVLAALVLGAPTVLMGGTLPAAVKSAESAGDERRRAVGWLYAANTLGAVLGALLCTLVLLEALGTRRALWAAAALNALVAGVAMLLSRETATVSATAPVTAAAAATATATAPVSATASLPPRFILAFAGVSGFVFFWMELVWYRLLGPLLGGSVYTFGLILAVVLLGIGAGGLLYGAFTRRFSPSPRGLALTAALEALLVGLPFALGDRMAILALAVRPPPGDGLYFFVPGWLLVAALYALPAALVAGAQYPLLVGLLGRGDKDVGSHLGAAAACNTLGAMAGSLLGGFLLLPGLGALGSLRAVVLALAGMGAATLWFSRKEHSARKPIAAPVLMTLAVASAVAPGPTAALRHMPIGAGRVDRVILDTPAFTRSFLQDARRNIIWEREGRESSVALDATDGLAMVVNGKIDGNARGDAGTQVPGGLIGAMLHPAPKRGMVIGLGTGSSAGWLAKVPAIERVDVAELEASMLEVATKDAPVNEDVVHDPKVRVLIGDAREVLLTIPERYDIIFSEPSNPYRAGVASLFTREYYEAAKSRLAPGGLFLQWVQVYEIDAATVRTIYATLASVFPEVESWYLGWNDLVLVASMEPLSHDVARMQARAREEPFRRAFAGAWRAEELSGIYAHYVAGPAFARSIADGPGQPINTDDRNIVEFGFAKHVGQFSTVSAFFEPAHRRKEDRPAIVNGTVDWARVAEERIGQITGEGSDPPIPDDLAPDVEVRGQALVNYAAGNVEGAIAKWKFQEKEPIGPTETCLVAEGLALTGDDAALPLLEKHAKEWPLEADAIRARYLLAKGKRDEAAAQLEKVFTAYRRDPWPMLALMSRTLDVARAVAAGGGAPAERVFAALAEPFSVMVLDNPRKLARVDVAKALPDKPFCVEAFEALEPHPPWDEDLLKARAECYQRWKHAQAAEAAKDVARFAACQGWKGWITCL